MMSNSCTRQVLGGILRQAVSHHLGQWWAREWAGWWWLTGVIVTTAYTTNLVAFLTVPVFPRRIETVEQLATSNLRVAMQDYGSFVPDALRASPDPALYKLGANLDLFPYVYLNYEVGFSWVSNRTHGLVETRSYLAYVVSLHNVSGATYVMKETVRIESCDFVERDEVISVALTYTFPCTSLGDLHSTASTTALCLGEFLIFILCPQFSQF
ncbi:uncharacterized protein LOC135114680 [Scylla paramamosain]|uniref:uncharacterized protein LOC135114680 n=1 Tax=Scylla paramamosain TaxID=85552 RepID=UPI003082E959